MDNYNQYIELFKQNRGLDNFTYDKIINRDISYGFTKFLDEDVFLQLLHSVKSKKILIFPDYDADGIMSGTILHTALSEMRFESDLYYPTSSFGYGLSEASLMDALSYFPDTKVIITCDNGISSIAGISKAKQLGLTVLVTDHHPQHTDLPPADVVVDPSRVDDNYPFKRICGAQVVYHLMLSYAREFHPESYENILNLGVFARIASVCDNMPMLEENRNLVRASLNFMDNLDSYAIQSASTVYNDAFKGLCSLRQKLITENKYSCSDEDNYRYYIRPLLNATRRVTRTSASSFKLFTNDNFDNSFTDKVYNLNEERKSVTNELYSIVESNINTTSPLVFRTTPIIQGGSGYARLLAGRLSGDMLKPTICFSIPSQDLGVPDNLEDILQQDIVVSRSGRAPGYFSLTSYLSEWSSANPKAQLTYGGHHQACGVSINIKYLQQFSEDLTIAADRAYRDYIDSLPDGVTKEADLEFSIRRYDSDAKNITSIEDVLPLFHFCEEIKKMKPFGNSWPKPLLKFSIDTTNFFTKTIGKESQHIKLSSKIYPFDILYWNGASEFTSKSSQHITVFGDIDTNTFNGISRLNLKVNNLLYR